MEMIQDQTKRVNQFGMNKMKAYDKCDSQSPATICDKWLETIQHKSSCIVSNYFNNWTVEVQL